jgi:hypothetical protein
VAVLFRGDHHLQRGTPEQQELQLRHLAFNRKQAEAAMYKAFGPQMDGGEILALGVIDVRTAEEAQPVVDGDPAIQCGHFRAEVHPLFWPKLDNVVVRYEP